MAIGQRCPLMKTDCNYHSVLQHYCGHLLIANYAVPTTSEL